MLGQIALKSFLQVILAKKIKCKNYYTLLQYLFT